MKYITLDQSKVVVCVNDVVVAVKGKAGIDQSIVIGFKTITAPMHINYLADLEGRDADFELLVKCLKRIQEQTEV